MPGGMSSRLGQLLDVAYTIEYGADSQRAELAQPPLPARLLGPGPVPRLREVEREVPRPRRQRPDHRCGCATRLPGQITLGAELVAIKRRPDGALHAHVQAAAPADDGHRRQARARAAVLDPPRLGRSLAGGFLGPQAQAIASRAWERTRSSTSSSSGATGTKLGSNGETFADTGYQNTWEVSRAQPGASGILVDYTGGTIGASFGSGSPATRAKQFLDADRASAPRDLRQQWNGKATLDFWPGYAWTRGSYSYWKVGQYTAFAGIEGRPEGNCHFCGEHTSIDFQGYLNGAVETGERAAGEVIADLS